MTIKIVTDSSITIEPELVEELDITVVPLSVTIDGTTYLDSDLPLDSFMEKMKASKALPKTSQPPVGVFAEKYEEIASEEDAIISIHITESLSGTVQAARQGAMLSGRDVTVLDSDFTDQGLKFQVVEAARLAKEGLGKEEILRELITYVKIQNCLLGFRHSKTWLKADVSVVQPESWEVSCMYVSSWNLKTVS